MSSSSTTIRAEIDMRFYMRFLLIGAAALGFAGWSAYDGAVTYPAQRIRALEYDRLHQEHRTSEWPQLAEEKGWPTAPPGEPKTEADFNVQFIMAAACTLIGLWLLLVVWLARGRWIEADSSGISSSWGQSLQFDQVQALNKKQWRDKGIAKVKYTLGQRNKRFVLDAFKFDRNNTDTILRRLEERIGADKIVGGRPEPPPQTADYNEAAAAAQDSNHSG